MTKFKSSRNVGLIKGTTVINHKKRIELQISCDEYVFLDAIEQIQQKKGYFSSSEHKRDVYRLTGFSGVTYGQLGKSLISKKFLIPHKQKYAYKLSIKWEGDSKKNEKEFEILWKFLNKVGNRKSAFDMFCRAKKSGTTYEHLMKRAKEYKKFLELSDQYQMHVSSWLNPTYAKFNDEWKIQSKKKDNNNDEQSTYKGKF